MITFDFINTMNENEIKEAIQLLKQCLKDGKIGLCKADPTKQYCYISSGSIEGVYFPNTEFEYCSDILNIVCVCKYRNELGVMFKYTEEFLQRRKEKKPSNYDYNFASFESILYTYEERRIIERLTAEINAYNNDLQVINNIEYQVKKDNDPFADLKKNFV